MRSMSVTWMPKWLSAAGAIMSTSFAGPLGRDYAHRPTWLSSAPPAAVVCNAAMRIDWDVPITVDDGLVLRADVFRPDGADKHPVILSYGPYGKWLHFED